MDSNYTIEDGVATKIFTKTDTIEEAATRARMKEVFEGLSEFERSALVDILPVDLCVARISMELNKQQRFKDAIMQAIDIF